MKHTSQFDVQDYVVELRLLEGEVRESLRQWTPRLPMALQKLLRAAQDQCGTMQRGGRGGPLRRGAGRYLLRADARLLRPPVRLDLNKAPGRH